MCIDSTCVSRAITYAKQGQQAPFFLAIYRCSQTEFIVIVCHNIVYIVYIPINKCEMVRTRVALLSDNLVVHF